MKESQQSDYLWSIFEPGRQQLEIPKYDLSSSAPSSRYLKNDQWNLTFTATEMVKASFGGELKTREIVAESLGSSAEHLYLTTGGCSEANYLVLQTLMASGGEILIESPAYDPASCLLRGINDVCIKRFSLLREPISQIKKLITKDTKVISISSPNNPTGLLYDLEELASVIEQVNLSRPEPVYVHVDQVYFKLALKQLQIASQLSPFFVATFSTSKCYPCNSLKIGVISGSPNILRFVAKYNTLMQCTNSFILERVWQEFFRNTEAALTDIIRKDWICNRDILINFCRENSLDFILPAGGNTAVIKTKLSGKIAAEQCYSAGVTVTPGEFFDLPDYIRIGFLQPTARELAEALQRIKQFLALKGTT